MKFFLRLSTPGLRLRARPAACLLVKVTGFHLLCCVFHERVLLQVQLFVVAWIMGSPLAFFCSFYNKTRGLRLTGRLARAVVCLVRVVAVT